MQGQPYSTKVPYWVLKNSDFLSHLDWDRPPPNGIMNMKCFIDETYQVDMSKHFHQGLNLDNPPPSIHTHLAPDMRDHFHQGLNLDNPPPSICTYLTPDMRDHFCQGLNLDNPPPVICKYLSSLVIHPYSSGQLGCRQFCPSVRFVSSLDEISDCGQSDHSKLNDPDCGQSGSFHKQQFDCGQSNNFTRNNVDCGQSTTLTTTYTNPEFDCGQSNNSIYDVDCGQSTTSKSDCGQSDTTYVKVESLIVVNQTTHSPCCN